MAHDRAPRAQGERKSFAETDYIELLDSAHQRLKAPLGVVWDNLKTHVNAFLLTRMRHHVDTIDADISAVDDRIEVLVAPFCPGGGSSG